MKKRGILFWRVVLSVVFMIFIDIFIKVGLENGIYIGVFLFASSFILLKDAVLIKIVNIILSDEFDVKVGFFYKCLILIASASIFTSLVILVGYYELSSDAPTNIVIPGSLLFYSMVAYVFRNKHLPLCGSFKEEK